MKDQIICVPLGIIIKTNNYAIQCFSVLFNSSKLYDI